MSNFEQYETYFKKLLGLDSYESNPILAFRGILMLSMKL